MNSLFLLVALCLPVGQLQNKGNNVAQYDPVITSVQTRMSYEPGPVSITGQHFDMVTGVKIDGHAVRIVSQTRSQIVIWPENMLPGFATLELLRPGSSVKGTIEFAPSLRAARLGTTLRVMVNPGEPGLIWLNWSPRTLVAQVPGVYYPQMIDLMARGAGLISQASSYEGEAVVITAPLPAYIALYGDGLRMPSHHLGVHVQAFCMLGGDSFLCHTNMVTVVPPSFREGSLEQ